MNDNRSGNATTEGSSMGMNFAMENTAIESSGHVASFNQVAGENIYNQCTFQHSFAPQAAVNVGSKGVMIFFSPSRSPLYISKAPRIEPPLPWDGMVDWYGFHAAKPQLRMDPPPGIRNTGHMFMEDVAPLDHGVGVRVSPFATDGSTPEFSPLDILEDDLVPLGGRKSPPLEMRNWHDVFLEEEMALQVHMYDIDRAPRFRPGRHYGPALDPILIDALKVDVQLNPILTLPDISTTPDEALSHRSYLKWNMLFKSDHCKVSTGLSDATHQWFSDRISPATWPKLTSLKLTFHPRHALPWTWVIKPKNTDHCLYVTCEDVISGISTFIQRPSAVEDYSPLPLSRKLTISEAYRRNRSILTHDVPGEGLGKGLRNLDFLGQEHVFGGLEKPDASVLVGREKSLCTFVINLRSKDFLGGGSSQGRLQSRVR